MKVPFNRQRFTLYLWFGAVYLVLWVFSDFINELGTFGNRVINNIWLILYLTVVNFILFEYTLPFIKLRWERLIAAPFLLVGHMLLYSFGLYFWRSIGIALHIYTEIRVHPSIKAGVTWHFPYAFMSFCIFGILKIITDVRRLRISTQQLRIEKQQAELNYLKSQTNPHFLFNTLNNIYSLARDKSDLAPESILKLSTMLRYMLYETSGPYIAIEQELKIISDYIALEKLRYDSSLRIDFNYDVEDMKQALPPLLLIPLVENAFKHGVSESRGNAYVQIHLSVRNRQLQLVVKNPSDAMPTESITENIGLSNLRRQLELLYTQYDLTVGHDGSSFTAVMKINLASHV